MHQTVENVLIILLRSNPPINMTQVKDFIDHSLAQVMNATRNNVMTTLGSIPGSLAFRREIFLKIPLVANWKEIYRNLEKRINDDMRHYNRKRCQSDYVLVRKVMNKVHDLTGLGLITTVTYKI